MLADFLRKYFGGVRVALTFIILVLIIVVCAIDLKFNGVSVRIYGALGGALGQVITFTLSEAQRKTGE